MVAFTVGRMREESQESQHDRQPDRARQSQACDADPQEAVQSQPATEPAESAAEPAAAPAQVPVVAVVLAAGFGTRFDARNPKQLVAVANKPVVCWSIEAFEYDPRITDIVVVVNPQVRDEVERLVD